jgi:uroporphyrinogen III methyltransferase/synthase
MEPQGTVFLVGAGPWDPGLLTLRGKDLLERADVLVYDYLANPALLDLAPPQAERIYVGKKGTGEKTRTQEQINALLIEKARSGKRVVRLKGGDPYLFGRGGEEAEVLAAAGVPFEVVPGITAAFGASAFAGVPLTHRSFTSTVAFITGHEDPTKKRTGVNWEALARLGGTLVMYMGMKNLALACQRLIDGALPPDTPAAVVHRATHPVQRVVSGTVGDIAEKVAQAEIGAPAMLIVGKVVSLREQLAWFEHLPLFGRTIVVTRARTQASRFAGLLREYGANVVEFPTIEFRDPPDSSTCDQAIQNLESYDWVIFTSPNAVERFMARVMEKGRDLRALGQSRIAAIGPETAKAVRRHHLLPDLLPDSYVAESLVEAFRGVGVSGKRILLPRALQARETLPEELRNMGAEVHVAPVYQTVRPDPDPESLALFRQAHVDMITFTASSTVINFMELLEDEDRKSLGGVQVACIGPITAEKARSFGLEVTVEPDEYTIPALAEAIVRYYRHKES